MTPDEIDRLQRLVPSDSDAAHALWKAKRQLAHCCPECDDADRRELRHVLFTPQTCTMKHSEDSNCPVCDGGLAVCARCGEYEAGLDKPCVSKADADRRELVTTFDHDWATAPRSTTTDYTLAAYWWFKGRTAGRVEGLVQSNADMAEMVRARKERLR